MKKSFKDKIARVFDDNLKTEQWHNWADYLIIGLILLSTVEVFLSTYENIVTQYGTVLKVIDWTTTVIFTIEVSLRIWCADRMHTRYKGFKGRLKYCFSFYGLIDVLSTFPFYLQFLLPINYQALKSLRMIRIMRMMRVLRILRYTKSIEILGRAMKTVKDQMLVSMQFLTIVTLLLSFILYFVEHDAQPDVYENGSTSVLWAFMQYIGDPGGFADTPPITVTGRVIASIIGVLGIAIFAVPAGLVGSAFSDVMNEDEHERKCEEWKKKLHNVFERKLDRITRDQICPKFVSVADIQALQGLKQDEILDAIVSSNDFRLINLAATRTIEEQAQDRLAVEHFPMNRPYGCFINRGSRVTIMNAVGCVDPIVSWASFYLAKYAGFNYISREVGGGRPFKSFYINTGEDSVPMLKEYMDDLRSLAPSDDCWIITSMAASGAQEPTFPTEIHFTYGAKRGDQTYDDPTITIHDIDTFDAMQKDMAQTLDKIYNLKTDSQLYYDNSNKNVYVRHWDYHPNAIGLRIAWSVMCWDTRTSQILKTIAEVLNRHLEPHVVKTPDLDLKVKGIAYDGTF